MNKLGLGLCALLLAANARASISLANVFASQREGTKFVDIGNSVAEGTSRHIVWDGGADLNGVLISNLAVFLNVSEADSSGMARVPAGTNSGTDPDFGSHSLTVDAFLMDATEVTREEWIAVADLAGDVSSASGAGKAANHPV